MIKKLMLLCVAAMVTMRTWAATEIVNGIEWVYEVSNDGIIVVEAFRNGEELPWALESDGVLAVPEKIGGYPVREIGDRFMPGGHDMTLKKVVLPNSIVKIGQSAFEGNNALSEINFPEGLRELSYKSFEECGLEKIIIPEGVTEIPENCFRQCYSLAEVYLPKSLKNIRMSAFEECPKLKAIHCAGEKPKLDPYALYKSPNAVFYSGVGVENYAVSAYVVDGCETMGKVTGGKAAKAGTKLTLKATANRGYVFAGWEGPLDGSQDPRNPSASYVVGEDDAEFVARFIPVEDDVAAISFTMSKEYENGVTIDSVSVDVSSCTSLPTVKVAGLPAGLKFTAKPIYKKGSKTEVEVPANTIYGAPTKSGVYTVVATVTTAGKKTATCSQTVIVRKSGEKVVVAECDATGGKVTGGGVYATGKKVTLKAAANKGYVFAGWYLDADGLSPVESTVDFRTASLSYVMTAAPETTLYAKFVAAEEDSDIALYVDGNEITSNVNDNNFVAEGTTILPLQMDSISIPKAAVSGLPAGMKYTDKALTVKATKTEDAYDVPANAIYGTPTKPGLYTVSVKLTNTTVKKAIEKKFTIEVPNMRSGLYDNSLAYETSSYPIVVGLSDFSRYPAFTIPEGAKVSVSGLPTGMKWDAKNGVFTGVPTKSGTFTVTITTTIGRDKFIDMVTLDVEALPENLVGTYTGLIGRDVNVGKDDPWMAYGMANVNVAANGKITAKMTLPCGTYSFSAASWDYVEDGIYSAVMRTKNGDEFELVIDSKRNWKEIAEDSALLIDGYKEFRVPIWRNEHVKGGNIESDPVANKLISEIKALKKVAFKVEGSKSSGYEVTEVASNDRSANLTVTFDTKGGVKYAGNFDGVRVSGSTFLCVDNDSYYTICDIVVPVGKTESVYIAFGIERDEHGELQFEVDVAWDEFQENNRDYDKVQLWENGPYWATTNIGAEKPWNSGYYFYWGDKVGSSRNFSFSASNTPTMGKDISALQRDGWITLDNVLSPEHDAARVQWGGRWRMPSYEEFKDLNNNCDWDWTIVNGVKGYIVRGRGDYASVSIFFPCAGRIFNSSIELSGSECWYWSSTACWSDAHQYTFSRSFQITKYVHGTGSAYRYYGFLIRPVQGLTK